MTPQKDDPVILRRWQAIVLVILSATLAGMLVYKKAYASEVKVDAVKPPVKQEPVESNEVTPDKPADVEDPGPVERSIAWLKQKKQEYIDQTGDIPLEDTRAEEELPIDVVDRLTMVFEDNQGDLVKKVVHQGEVDAEELACVVKALFFEAGGEPPLGKRWVYDVIRNRTLVEYRGNTTMCDTIFDSKQFSFANLNPDRVPSYSEDLIQVTELVESLYFDKDHKDITCGATHYLRKDLMWKVNWSRQALRGVSNEGLVLKAVIGDHAFFGKEGCEDVEDQW